MSSLLCHGSMQDWSDVQSVISNFVNQPTDLWHSLFGEERTPEERSKKVPNEIVVYKAPQFHSGKSIAAAAFALNIKKTARKESKHQKKDGFRPQPSPLAQRAFGPHLRSDYDIWVERSYINRKNKRTYFYRSYKTGKCVMSEPPSGAQAVIYQSELDKAPPAIQKFATEKLDRKDLLSMRKERLQPTNCGMNMNTFWRGIFPNRRIQPEVLKKRQT